MGDDVGADVFCDCVTMYIELKLQAMPTLTGEGTQAPGGTTSILMAGYQSQPELPAQGSVEGDIWSALPASKRVLVAHFSQHLLFILLYASSDFIHVNSLFDHWVLPCCSWLPYFLFLVTLFALPSYPICSSWLPYLLFLVTLFAYPICSS